MKLWCGERVISPTAYARCACATGRSRWKAGRAAPVWHKTALMAWRIRGTGNRHRDRRAAMQSSKQNTVLLPLLEQPSPAFTASPDRRAHPPYRNIDRRATAMWYGLDNEGETLPSFVPVRSPLRPSTIRPPAELSSGRW